MKISIWWPVRFVGIYMLFIICPNSYGFAVDPMLGEIEKGDPSKIFLELGKWIPTDVLVDDCTIALRNGDLQITKPKSATAPEYVSGPIILFELDPATYHEMITDRNMMNIIFNIVPNKIGGHILMLKENRRWFDTGGYYTRSTTEIYFDKNGKLVGVDAKHYLSERDGLIFGKYGDFKEQESIKCGLAISKP